MIYLLTVRDGEAGRTVVPARLRSGTAAEPLGDLDAFRVEPELTFLVHGFNVSRADGKRSLLQMARLLEPHITGGLVAVLWPGDHWSGPLSYSGEGRDADDSAFELARFITDHAGAEARLNFVAHSLGSRVVLETVSRLTQAPQPIGQICLLAAAVDDDSLADPDVYFLPTETTGRVSVLYSKQDRVLQLAYPAGDLLQAFLYWRDESGGALGYHGPKKHAATRTRVRANVYTRRTPGRRKSGHGDYLPDVEINDEQISASEFVIQALLGDPAPTYPPRPAP